jgi:dsRNA-specific ribonuclease
MPSPLLLLTTLRACITPDSAVSHIHHFCACLPHEPYVDLSPAFSYTENPATKLISATVTLPTCLIASVRSTKGILEWRTERCAAKDASFQAYKALYEAGLLNDNLLPLSHSWVEEEQYEQEDLAATIEIRSQLNPWKQLAEAWSHCDFHQTRIVLKRGDGETNEELCMVLTTPLAIPAVSPMVLYWDEETTFHLHYSPLRKVSLSSSGTVQTLRGITHILTRSARSDQTADNRMDFAALFSPDLEENQLSTWYKANSGRVPALHQYLAKTKPCGLVRSAALYGTPNLFYRWYNPDIESQSELEVQCIPLTKRRNFLSSNNLSLKVSPFSSQGAIPSTFQSLPIENCTIDRLPFTYVQFGLFMQAILQQVKSFMVAEKLRSTILKHVPINGVQHIITAISAPSAGLTTDYQRYEFFGDAVLKFFVSHHLFCDKENWHEGYLTKRKSQLVSNQQLARAALDKGLDVFIMTEGFKSRKWTPPLISEILADPVKPREISMKMVADVVEALIGAAYIDSGFEVARKCLHVFLPEIRIETPQPSRALPTLSSTSLVINAESIIGYKFNKKILLLESLTHPSCDHDMKVESYQRLEFLGDAILDMLVVRLLASSRTTTTLSPGRMTLTKAALVNTQFLGFLCLDYGIDSAEVVRINEIAPRDFKEMVVSHKSCLWTLMRHTNKDIQSSQDACQARYITHRDSLHQVLAGGREYPWLQLARLNPDKFYSDMIESMIGAIFLDSNGCLTACEDFIERIGLVSYLKRLLEEEVDLQHPKSILGQLAGTEGVSYDEKPAPREADDTEKRYTCTVTVGEIDIAVAEDCLSKDEAVLAAAIQAADKLRERDERIIAVRGGPRNKE